MEILTPLEKGTIFEMPLPNGETLQSLFNQWPSIYVDGNSTLISYTIDKIGLRTLIDISCATRLDTLHIRETHYCGGSAIVLKVCSSGPYDHGAAPNPLRYIMEVNGRLIIKNEKLCIDPCYERNRVAKTAIARQIRAAINDFGAIWVDAAGSGYANRTSSGARQLTGYDYWPKLGFDGDLTPIFWTELLQSNINVYNSLPRASVRTVRDLRSLPGGENIWKQHGIETMMKIELSALNPDIVWVNGYLGGLGI
ncbi:MAG: hypothetical protein ABF727_08905 [Gluconobacter oxydans]